MRRAFNIVLLLVALLGFSSLNILAGDRIWRIHSPRGDMVAIVIKNAVLERFRIYDLGFSEEGDKLMVTAAPMPPGEASSLLSIGLYKGADLVQEGYASFGPQKTTQGQYCPEDFNRIIIDYSGY